MLTSSIKEFNKIVQITIKKRFIVKLIQLIKKKYLELNKIIRILIPLAIVVVAVFIFKKDNSDNIVEKEKLPIVRTKEVKPNIIKKIIVRNGKTSANKSIKIITRIDGKVIKINNPKGSIVKEGDLIVTLDTEDRDERVRELKALVEQRKIELKSHEELAKKKFKAVNEIAASKTNLKKAIADLVLAEKNLSHCSIRAAFDGVVDDIIIEEGSSISSFNSSELGHLVQISPIKFITYVTDNDLPYINVGDDVPVFIDAINKELIGKISYVSVDAVNETQTFKVEIIIDNKDRSLKSGMSGSSKLGWEKVSAHYIPSSILSLDDKGVVGIKIVVDGKAIFKKIQIVDATTDGIWVGGLNGPIEVITLGGDFVKSGTNVNAVRKDLDILKGDF